MLTLIGFAISATFPLWTQYKTFKLSVANDQYLLVHKDSITNIKEYKKSESSDSLIYYCFYLLSVRSASGTTSRVGDPINN